MALETATHINGLNSSIRCQPTPSQPRTIIIRLLKSTIKASFPNISGAMNASHTELNTDGRWYSSHLDHSHPQTDW